MRERLGSEMSTVSEEVPGEGEEELLGT